MTIRSLYDPIMGQRLVFDALSTTRFDCKSEGQYLPLNVNGKKQKNLRNNIRNSFEKNKTVVK